MGILLTSPYTPNKVEIFTTLLLLNVSSPLPVNFSVKISQPEPLKGDSWNLDTVAVDSTAPHTHEKPLLWSMENMEERLVLRESCLIVSSVRPSQWKIIKTREISAYLMTLREKIGRSLKTRTQTLGRTGFPLFGLQCMTMSGWCMRLSKITF